VKTKGLEISIEFTLHAYLLSPISSALNEKIIVFTAFNRKMGDETGGVEYSPYFQSEQAGIILLFKNFCARFAFNQFTNKCLLAGSLADCQSTLHPPKFITQDKLQMETSESDKDSLVTMPSTDHIVSIFTRWGIEIMMLACLLNRFLCFPSMLTDFKDQVRSNGVKSRMNSTNIVLGNLVLAFIVNKILHYLATYIVSTVSW